MLFRSAEFNEKLIEANEKINELLAKYPELNSILKKVRRLSDEYLESIISSPLSYKVSSLMLAEHPDTVGRLRTSAFTKLAEIFYENKPEDVVDNYSGDYFFIINNGKVQQVIFSDYSDKNISSSGEHNAYFEDVTFDSDKDLIVGLRCGTANCFSRAYIFNDGKYEYTPSFEEIPNYKINNENSEILGFSKDSACNYTYYHYNYVNTKFEEGYKYERNACLEQ